jgi:hypothetical protein
MKIKTVKENTNNEMLCATLPKCFKEFMDYVMKMDFKDEPDY